MGHKPNRTKARSTKKTSRAAKGRKVLGKGMRAILGAESPPISDLERGELAGRFVESVLQNPAIHASQLNPTAEKIVELAMGCADELRRALSVAPVSGLERELLEVLGKHCGERGDSEGAVDTLKRIIAEREKLTNFEADPERVKLFATPVTVVVGEKTIARLRAGDDVELDGAILVPDSPLKSTASAAIVEEQRSWEASGNSAPSAEHP